MSRPSNGHSGYTNGNYAQETLNHYDDDRQNENTVGGGRERRGGGYGGFVNNTLSVPTENERQPSSQRRGSDPNMNGSYSRSRSERDTDWDSSSRSRERKIASSRPYGSGPGSRQIEGVLEHIQEHWEVMTKDDCLPVHVALQLMDHSSLGRGGDYQDFQRTNRQLQKALKAIVNEHHQGFNSSIGTFHKIQSSIQASQTRVRTLKESIYDAKANLMISKPELKGLGTSSQEYEDMLQVLGQIEKLQMVPEQLDARIADKHFLSAVDLLQDALRIIRKSEMEKIGALTDLRIYFSNQETSLTDILIEELHDHLYLKSPYCSERWKPYTPELKGMGSGDGVTSLPNARARPLYQFLNGLDTSLPPEDDASRNPEMESFQYIYIVIESLNKMGRLDVAIDRMEQRLPIELFSIVDKTNQEVDQRHSGYLRDVQKSERGIIDFDLDGNSSRSHVLKDLLWTLYSKFEAIAEGHRAVHDVVAGIIKREGLGNRNSLTGGFREMWKLYQSEIRSLLHNYLATNGNPLYRVERDSAVESNIFQKTPRDRNKRIFKFASIDKKSPDLAGEQEELDRILQASVPGLVSKSLRRSGVSHNNIALTSDAPVAGHKLLIESNVFNISLLLPPSLSFLQRLKDIVPVDSDVKISTLTSFLDHFLVNVFHPQLEETVTELCTRSFIDLEAFQQDSQWSQHAIRPIFRGTSTFFALIRAFCKLLDTIPQDQAFTQLIISQIVAYYDRCCGWYRVLVARVRKSVEEEIRLKTAAAMAESGDLREIVEKLWISQGDEPETDDLRLREINLLISKTNETPLEPFDIISDRKSVEALCLLYSSLQWLAARLSQLRRITNSHSHHDPSRPSQTRRWTALSSMALQDPRNPVYLPLTTESASIFDKTISSLRALANIALLTLHLDIRAGIIHMLARVLATPYLLSHPATDPDPAILALNADLLSFDDTLTMHLQPREHAFITSGLAALVDALLVRNAATVQAMNQHGCGRMQLNILVLQQNLKAVETGSGDGAGTDVMLGRSANFFALFMEGAVYIVEKAQAIAKAREQTKLSTTTTAQQDQKFNDTKAEAADANANADIGVHKPDLSDPFFSLEELKVLIELCYSEGLRSPHREVAVQAKRGLSEHLLVLNEVLWNA